MLGPGLIQAGCSTEQPSENQGVEGLRGQPANHIKKETFQQVELPCKDVCSLQAEPFKQMQRWRGQLSRDLTDASPDEVGFLDDVISEIPSNLKIQ